MVDNEKSEGLEDSNEQYTDAVELALREAVWASLKPVTTVLALMYLLFAVGHIFLMPIDIRYLMASLAGGTAIVLVCIAFVSLQFSYVEKLVYPVSFFVLLLATGNSAIHLYLTDDILQSTNVILVIFGASFFILSTTWFFISISMIISTWLLVALNIDDQGYLVHFGFAVFSSTLISIVFHFVHVRDLNENHRLRLISEKQRKKATYLAMHDFLTGLPNRRLFVERTELSIAMARRSDLKVGILFCDLNDFKPMNDTFGHEFGDEVLKEVGSTLVEAIRETDLAARFGGDEFAVVLTNLKSRDDLYVVIAKITRAFEDERELMGRTTKIGLSIGSALYPDDSGEVEALLEFADQDMYAVKQAMKEEREKSP